MTRQAIPQMAVRLAAIEGGIDPAMAFRRSRAYPGVLARHIGFLVSFNQGLPKREIGRVLGYDHSTVFNGIQVINDLVDVYPHVRDWVARTNRAMEAALQTHEPEPLS